MHGDWPDAAAFWNALSPVLATASRRKRPVRVFGEMVALLWDDGLVAVGHRTRGALERDGQAVFVLAAVRISDRVGTAPEFSDALAQVCGAHTASAGLPELAAEA